MRVESCLTATSVGKEEEEESSETQENTMREQEGHDGVPRSNARGLPHSTVTFRHPPPKGSRSLLWPDAATQCTGSPEPPSLCFSGLSTTIKTKSGSKPLSSHRQSPIHEGWLPRAMG